MKSTNVSLAILASLAALSVGIASAQTSSGRSAVEKAQQVGPAPKVVSRSRQPVGTPHKASSFAPHHTTRRRFGAPIQAPIVRNDVALPKKPVPKR